MSTPPEAIDSAPCEESLGALTARPGHLTLSDWTTVRLAGKDRAAFLHNMCTNDIRSLAPGSGCEAFLTDVKGKIVAHVFALAADDELLLVGVPGLGPKMTSHLDRYVIREDVQLEDRTASIGWILVAGRGADSVVEAIGEVPAAAFESPWSHREASLDGTAIRIVRCDLPWTGGWLIGCPAESLTRLKQRLLAAGATVANERDWLALRLESGWPLEGVDFDASNLPQEIGRDAQAIHFRKGCYLGQETIARIDALGHVNKRLATVRIAGELPPEGAAELTSDSTPVGRATSVGWSPTLGVTLGLAMVKRGYYEPGQQLTCGTAQAAVVQTPAVPR
jgi:folate-binding protein YgfZ